MLAVFFHLNFLYGGQLQSLDDNFIIYYLYYMNLSIKYLVEKSSSFIWRLFLAIFHARQTNVRQQCAVPHQLSPRRAVMNETGVVFCQFEINGTTITLQAHITYKKGQCEQMEVKTFKLGSNDLCIMDCFIYILDSSNSSSITFLTIQFSSSSRSN